MGVKISTYEWGGGQCTNIPSLAVAKTLEKGSKSPPEHGLRARQPWKLGDCRVVGGEQTILGSNPCYTTNCLWNLGQAI